MSADVWPIRHPERVVEQPEPPRTGRGLRKIRCHLYDRRPHGSHRYTRGDERVVCEGVPRG